MKNNHFKIVTPMYNVEDWIALTIKTVLAQDYTNYEWILVDDMSTDNTVEIVEELTKDISNIRLIVNKEKKFALRNICDATAACNPKPNDIIVNLDGDDWLPNSRVLSYLNEVYQDDDVWLTYGNHVNWPDIENQPFPIFQYPEYVVKENSYRNFRFLASHMRAYRHALWAKVKQEDLLGEDGKHWQTAWDLAYMIPMCEMAGPKAKFLSKHLYVYNNTNPLNDYKIYTELQQKQEMEIRTGKAYERIEEL
tara:strand:- start:8174 stop:8926 length:753 start_codon:yes stop_codon:yes gene_type:complete